MLAVIQLLVSIIIPPWLFYSQQQKGAAVQSDLWLLPYMVTECCTFSKEHLYFHTFQIISLVGEFSLGCLTQLYHNYLGILFDGFAYFS